MAAPVTAPSGPPEVNTGPTSTSFWISLLGTLSGLVGMAFTAFHGGHWAGPSDAVIGAGSALLAAVSTIFKLEHDKGVRVAAHTAVGLAGNADLQAAAKLVLANAEKIPAVETLATEAKNLAMVAKDQIDHFVPEQDQAAMTAAAEDAIKKWFATFSAGNQTTSSAAAQTAPETPPVAAT